MKFKITVALLVIILALGCTDGLKGDLDMSYKHPDCSQYDNSFNCSGRTIYINETIDGRCINYIKKKCHSSQFEFIDTTPIKPVPKPTLVIGYTHSEYSWYPLRGTWMEPSNHIINNTIWIGNRLYIYECCDNVTVRYSTFSANMSIRNSTNIVVAYANITRNINITNMRDFKLLGEGDALYYLNETPVSETIVNDTIIFAPIIEVPTFNLPTMPREVYMYNNTLYDSCSLHLYGEYTGESAYISYNHFRGTGIVEINLSGSDDIIIDHNDIYANISIINSSRIEIYRNEITQNITIINSTNIEIEQVWVNKSILIEGLNDLKIRLDKWGTLRVWNKTSFEVEKKDDVWILTKPKTSYKITVNGMGICSYITPCEIESSYTYDCRDVAEDYWRYNYTDDYPFVWAFDACENKFPELIQAEIDKDKQKSPIIGVLNLTVAPDDNIRSATLHYNAGGKEWKYITIYNATCHQIECPCYKKFGCMAYCLECKARDEVD